MISQSKLVMQVVLAFSLLVAVPACQQTVSTDYSKLDLASVSGTIAVDGSPLSDAYVIFEADDHTYSFAKTDASGAYTLQFNTEKEGILPGPKTVRIRTSGAFGAEGEMMDEEDLDEGETSTASKKSESLPETYHKESHLKVVVESGSQTVNFDLKKDGSTKTST